MLDDAKKVIRISLAIAAALLILWVIGITSSKGTHGMTAVSAGLSAVLKGTGQLLSRISF